MCVFACELWYLKVNDVVSIVYIHCSSSHMHTLPYAFIQVDGVVSQTDFESTAGSQNGAERIIQYTRIPINATGCPGNRIVSQSI